MSDTAGNGLDAMIERAIFESLSEKVREQMLMRAVDALTRKGTYGRSSIQEAFDAAVYKVAEKTAQDLLQGDTPQAKEARETLAAMVQRAWAQATSGAGQEKLVEKITSAIVATISGDRY